MIISATLMALSLQATPTPSPAPASPPSPAVQEATAKIVEISRQVIFTFGECHRVLPEGAEQEMTSAFDSQGEEGQRLLEILNRGKQSPSAASRTWDECTSIFEDLGNQMVPHVQTIEQSAS